VNGVGPASLIWVEDLLWWWKQTDQTIDYVGLTSEDFVNCDLKSFPNLKIYINPGGDAYDQIGALGTAGTSNIRAFVTRDQTEAPSAYVGFCAGGYLVSHDYIWESLYQGVDYYNFSTNPPLSLFPHTVEGSIVDINDDQYGDQSGSKYRVVNVSNGHRMVYYGGSTFGYNGVADYADPTSAAYDPAVEVLVYYSDFYGYYAYNIPAAWRYGNIIATSVHPEADNCTFATEPDCPPEGTLAEEYILQNRAWLLGYMNSASQSDFKIPNVPLAPVFDGTRPHTGYPVKQCYARLQTQLLPSDSVLVLFCDDFDSVDGQVAPGLAPQFQRNQSDYNFATPWNTSYISVWNNGAEYPAAYGGDGYAVCVPTAITSHYSSILTKPVSVAACDTANLRLSYQYVKQTVESGYLLVEYSFDGALDSDGSMENWFPLSDYTANSQGVEWTLKDLSIPLSEDTSTVRVRFTCAAGPSASEYCALDSLQITC